MDPNVQVAIVSGTVTILVGLITALFTYKGAIKGAQKQIEYEKESFKVMKENQEKLIRKAIEEFILNEIKYNFRLIDKSVIEAIKKADSPFSYSYGNTLYERFRFTEFERFKHELIKSESKIVEDIKEYYDMFYRMNYSTNLNQFNKNEFLNIKKLIIKYEENETTEQYKIS